MNKVLFVGGQQQYTLIFTMKEESIVEYDVYRGAFDIFDPNPETDDRVCTIRLKFDGHVCVSNADTCFGSRREFEQLNKLIVSTIQSIAHICGWDGVVNMWRVRK